MYPARHPKNSLLLVFLLSAWLLSACSNTIDIQFNSDDSWHVNAELAYDTAAFDFIKAQAPGLLNELLKSADINLAIPDSVFEGDVTVGVLEILAVYYRNLGLQAEADALGQRGSEAAYRLTVRGMRYEEFPNLLPGLITLNPVAGAGQRYDLTIAMGDWVTVGRLLGFEQVVTLRAGPVTRHNATSESFGAVTWRNASTIRATFEKPSPLSDLWPWLGGAVVVLVVVVGGGLVGYRLLNQPTARRGAPPPPRRLPPQRTSWRRK